MLNMNFLIKINDFIRKNEKKFILLIVILFIVIIFSFLFMKYQALGYNALDLGIYNQVFYNSAQGDLFAMSIHPHSYLGDHFEIFILVLLPFYYIFQSPLTLLFLQVLFIALSAWPIYLITKEKLKSPWPIIIILIFFLNPLVLNLLFFEFHLLPFAIPLLLFTFYFYYKNKFTPFIIFLFLSLLVREDVSLIIIMFGCLALIEKKSLKWILSPIVAGAIWFIGAMQLTGYFNQYGNYKFLSMYGWLGNSVSEIIFNILAHPWPIMKQIFSLNNFLSFVAIFIPFLGLPLLKPKYFIPALLVGAQLLLLSPNTSILIKTHYTSLFIPFIFISLIFTIAIISKNSTKNPIYSFIYKQKKIILTLFCVTILYSFFTLSPIWAAITYSNDRAEKNNFIKEKISAITVEENILTSFNFLPELSSRKYAYSLHYSFFGKKQYSDQNFNIDVPLDKAFIDFDDFTTYYVQAKYNENKEKLYPAGADRIKMVLTKNNLFLTDIFDSYALYEKNATEKYKLVEFDQPPTDNSNNQQLSYEINLQQIEKNINQVPQTIGLSFYWGINSQLDDDYFISLIALDNQDKNIYQKIYPLGYLIYPTSDWPVNQSIKTNYWFYLPEKIAATYDSLKFQLIKINNGRLSLDGQRTAIINITDSEKIGGSFTVNYKTL